MSKIILFIILISFILSKTPYPIENDVLVLDEKNFGQAVREFKYLLVLFFDPECPHCEHFMPYFEKLASKLKKESFVLAKFDSIKGEKITNMYEIEAFPTLKLIKKNDIIQFEGERRPELIEEWLREKTKPEFPKIKTKEDLENLKKDNNTFLVYFGKDEAAINELIIAERSIDDITFFTCDSDELIKENVNQEKGEAFVIFKNFDERKSIFSDTLTASNLVKFVNIYSYPKVILFSKDTSHIIFTKRIPALIIFTLKQAKYYEDQLKLLYKIYPNVKDKLKLFLIDRRDAMAGKLAVYCGISLINIPKVFIVHAKSEIPTKYEMTEEINEENVKNFIDMWSKGKLKPFIRSEEIPKKNEGDLFILVGNNFNEEVLENDKDVLIYFVSPWCKVCQTFEPKLAEFARKLKAKNPKLLIAIMDGTLNDVEGYQIHNFPTFKFYPANAKDKDPLTFHTRKNITSLYNFIKKNSFHKIIDDEDDKKTSDL
jgi:protein disulfide-isomerase A1